MMRFAVAAAFAVCAAPVAAAPPTLTPTAASPTATLGGQKLRSQVIDIALDNDHTLRGRFVDSAGAPVDGAVVTLKDSEHVIARSTTRADGTFRIDHVPAGSYRLVCGAAAGPIRCWTSETAPPNAVLDRITFQDNVVRGQAVAIAPALLGSSALTTAAASGSVIGGVAVYAAAEGGSGKGSTEPAVTVDPPPTVNTVPNGQTGGRNEGVELSRVPWRDRRLPPNLSGALDDPRFRPASP
ncbi:MAG TPA: carboxypeptidase-like regulatory domain-containing protein [Caulifigura sp.]|jgi:hypothetical protein|nr:carboxypeptidase-like regulatory domain-containing protein [Caulifigura sp.]